jgi:hypothetical protein
MNNWSRGQPPKLVKNQWRNFLTRPILYFFEHSDPPPPPPPTPPRSFVVRPPYILGNLHYRLRGSTWGNKRTKAPVTIANDKPALWQRDSHKRGDQGMKWGNEKEARALSCTEWGKLGERLLVKEETKQSAKGCAPWLIGAALSGI